MLFIPAAELLGIQNNNYWIQAFLGVQDQYLRNKEHIAATNHLCQINDPGSPGNTLVGNYCPFLGGSGMEILLESRLVWVEVEYDRPFKNRRIRIPKGHHAAMLASPGAEPLGVSL